MGLGWVGVRREPYTIQYIFSIAMENVQLTVFLDILGSVQLPNLNVSARINASREDKKH